MAARAALGHVRSIGRPRNGDALSEAEGVSYLPEMTSLQTSTHSSQIKTVGPAISLLTSF